jgi:hypothetical protein
MLRNLLIATTVALALIISSCSESPNATENTSNNDFQSFAIADINPSGFELQEATLESDFALTPIIEGDFANYDRLTPADNRPPQVNRMMAIGMILRQLNLTDEQIEKVKELIMNHRRCEAEWLKLLQQSRREIMMKGQEARQAIIRQYQAGEITREEAGKMINKLNMTIREALANNPVNEKVRIALQECWDTFIKGIKGILDEKQLELFEQWLKRMANGGGQIDDRKNDDGRKDDGKNTDDRKNADGTGNTRG